MLKTLNIVKYRKIKGLKIDLEAGINIISGTNGTCKTSLLYIASNAFQTVTRGSAWLKDDKCLDIIKGINATVNPKIEMLTRGDHEYNDPAVGIKGTLFTCTYMNDQTLEFRRHNSEEENRFAVKPFYKRGAGDSLPKIPVIYLGLSRLYPFGEYRDDDSIQSINKKLPIEYLDEISNLYKDFTGTSIEYKEQQKMGDIKNRAEFVTDFAGIDSNTISAGEDNLFIIITALVSLRYYYDCINSLNCVESMLLIDEFDATLHPAFQNKLLSLFDDYSKKYKIQFIFTTHSLSLLEVALKKKYNVIYLLDNINSVRKMADVDIYKIKMYLNSITKDDIYLSKSIPIFTEDNEARLFLNCLIEFFENEYEDFYKVKKFFHIVNASISSENLFNIFSDSYLLRSTMRSICILDGDQFSKQDYEQQIIVLPGKKSPENVIYEHVEYLFNNDVDDFWQSKTIEDLGYIKVYYRDNIRKDILEIEEKINQLSEANESKKGVRRELNKKLFNKHKNFFTLVLKHWINYPVNNKEIEKFYKDLKIMFYKVAEFHDINSREWRD